MSCRAVQALEFAKTSLGPKLWSRRPTVQQHTPTGDDPAKAVSRRPLDEKRKLPEQIGSFFFLVLRERLFNGYCKQVAMVTNGVTLWVNPYGQPDRKNTVFFYDFPKGSRQEKKRSFYGQADRKGGGQPPRP